MSPAEHAATVRGTLRSDGLLSTRNAEKSLAALVALAERATELEQSREKAIRERRSLEIQADDWHSAYDRAEARATELQRDVHAAWEVARAQCERAERAQAAAVRTQVALDAAEARATELEADVQQAKAAWDEWHHIAGVREQRIAELERELAALTQRLHDYKQARV